MARSSKKNPKKQSSFKLEIVTASRNKPLIIIVRGFHCNNLMDNNTIDRLHKASELIQNHIEETNTLYTDKLPKKGDYKYNERMGTKLEKTMEKIKDEYLIFSIKDIHDTTTETTIKIGHIHPNIRYKINIKHLVPTIIDILRKTTNKSISTKEDDNINWVISNSI